MISVVCVYNNESHLKDYLLKSLENQTVEFELIKIDNVRNRFKSAAEALNYGGKKAKGKYIMFVHQDVELSSNSWLEDAEKTLDYLPYLGIAGVAGAKEKQKSKKLEIITNVKHGVPPRIASYNPIQKPLKAQTLDECLVIIPKPIFDRLIFDEEVCNDWHLYTVDYCLCASKLGLSVYIIPLLIYHKSDGSLLEKRSQIILSLGMHTPGYYRTLKKLLKKHEKHFELIYTTCGTWSAKIPLISQRVLIAAKNSTGNKEFLKLLSHIEEKWYHLEKDA